MEKYMLKQFVALFFTVLPILLSSTVTRACASCGCTLSSDWEEASQARFRLDLRYDFIDQSQLRAGTTQISPDAASLLLSNGNKQEVEVDTKNYYVTASGEYAIDASWKVGLVVPYIMRSHSTLGTNSDGTNAGAGGGQYDSYTSSLGDARLLGRFQGFNEEHNIGITFGLKLPTGSFSRTGTATDPTASIPYPTIDPGLQPGSGTTDLILGAYFNKALDKNWDFFSEGLYQSALNVVANYRPGDGYNLNAGFRYFGLQGINPQIQVNSRFVEHDSGSSSDMFSTGGTLFYLSPGVVVPASSGIAFYGFVQVPLYQNLLGVQLTPTYTASVGARYIF